MTSRFNPRDATTSPANDTTVDASGKSITTPAVPRKVIFKLSGFSFAMIALPLLTYFATVNKVFGGNATLAGASAAIVANVVLVGYIVIAYTDDQTEQKAKKSE